MRIVRKTLLNKMDMACDKIYKSLILPAILLLAVSCGKVGKSDAEEAAAGQRLVETGELVAINNVAILVQRIGMQWFEMKVTSISEHGAEVKPGDALVELDADQVKKMILDKETNLETQTAALEKMEVDHESNIKSLEMAIKTATATFELQKIKLESSRFDSEKERKIRRLEFEQAEITFDKEKRKLDLAKIINACDIKIQRIRVKQLEVDLEETYKLLGTLSVKSPINGVFEISRRNTGLLKEGDMVYPGYRLGSVPDLSAMKVNTHVNENDFPKVREGQKVAVRLDAMPKLVFDGEITYIGKLCHPVEWNSRQKIFDVEVRILESDERLKPGMTVSCEFLPE